MKTSSHALRTLVALLAAAGIWSGCSNSTSTPTSNGPTTQWQWKQGETANFQKSTLDTTAGAPVVAGSQTTFTTTLVAANVPFYGRSSANIDANVYGSSLLTPTDSSIYEQETNGDLYQWNFGLSGGLAQLTTILAAAGVNIANPGWVLGVKMTGSTGINWLAYEHDTTMNVTVPNVPIPVAVQIKAIDQAQMLGDSTFVLNGTSYTTKHAQHTATFSATSLLGNLASWTEVIDTYVSADLASPVLTVTHPSTIVISSTLQGLIGFGSTKLQGTQVVLVSHS